jgi:hypothetical protein
MPNTLQTTLNWATAFIQNQPLSANTGSEPAVSIASMIRNSIMNAPMSWSWNRFENTANVTNTSNQDYVITVSNFGFLEKVSLTDSTGSVQELKDIYNTSALSINSVQQRPSAAAVISYTPGTSFKLRFNTVPDKIYTINLTYQGLSTQFVSLTDAWSPIPDQYSDVYNNLFLSEAFQTANDDQEAARYRQRGVAALLSKAEGLTQTQINIFRAQWLARDSEAMSNTLKTQMGNQARGV